MQLYLYFLPGILAFVIVMITTHLMEKCWPIVGEIITAMPQLVVINVTFIIINSPSNGHIKEALFIIPIGVISQGMFLLSWKYMPKVISFQSQTLRLFVLILCSFLFWFIAPLTFELYEFIDYNDHIIPYVGVSTAILTLIIGVATLITNTFELSFSDPELSFTTENESTDHAVWYTYKVYLARGIAALITVTLCNYLASVGLGILSGFMSVFPALLSVSIIFVWMVDRDKMQTQTMGGLLLEVTGMNIFALITAWLYLYESWNVGFSLLVSWLTAMLFVVIPMILFMQYKEKRNERLQTDKQLPILTHFGHAILVPQSTQDIFNMDADMNA